MVSRYRVQIATLLATIWASTSVLLAESPNRTPASSVTSAEPPVLSQATERALELLLNLNIEDLRPKAAQSTDYESTRLMCFSTRGFAYVFHVVQPRSKGAKLAWTEHDLRFQFQHQPSRSGTASLSETARLALVNSIDSPALRTALDDDKPVSIGHPYIYLIEIIEAGSYRIIRRDTPESSWQDRGLAGFNHVTRTLMKLANISQPDCHAPIPPDPMASGASPKP